MRQRLAGTEVAVAARNANRNLPNRVLAGKASVERVPVDFTSYEAVAPALRGVTGLLTTLNRGEFLDAAAH